jgi:hydrogenase-4 component H
MRKPKLRELKEALKAVFSKRFTTHYPFQPHVPVDGFRGKPEFNPDECIGCGACAEVCPALAIRVTDDLGAEPPTRTFTHLPDKCIYCGQCELYCPTQKGIVLTKQYDLVTLDRAALAQSISHDLVLCEVCGEVVGARKHLLWVARKLGAKAYSCPTLVVLADAGMKFALKDSGRPGEPTLARNDLMRVSCPACRRTSVIRELWGE